MRWLLWSGEIVIEYALTSNAVPPPNRLQKLVECLVRLPPDKLVGNKASLPRAFVMLIVRRGDSSVFTGGVGGGLEQRARTIKPRAINDQGEGGEQDKEQKESQ